MKEWLRRKLHNFIFSSGEDRDRLVGTAINSKYATVSARHSQTLSSDNEPLRFTVYNASGGKIVEISHYDQKQDRHTTSLHIITNDENFGEELGKIAFVELLKKG
jgi:hypothetical protein